MNLSNKGDTARSQDTLTHRCQHSHFHVLSCEEGKISDCSFYWRLCRGPQGSRMHLELDQSQKTSLNQSGFISSDLSQAENFSVLSCPKDNLIHHFFLYSYKLSSRQRNQRSNCQHPLDHRKSKRIPEKHLFLLYWLCQSLWLCGSQ